PPRPRSSCHRGDLPQYGEGAAKAIFRRAAADAGDRRSCLPYAWPSPWSVPPSPCAAIRWCAPVSGRPSAIRRRGTRRSTPPATPPIMPASSPGTCWGAAAPPDPLFFIFRNGKAHMALDLKSLVRTIPDYPKKGILFRDITTLIEHPQGF